MRPGVAFLADRSAAYLLFAAVALSPLPFGSTDPSAIAVWVIVLGCALVLARPHIRRHSDAWLFGVVAALIAGYLIVLHEQSASSTWFGISQANPLWKRMTELIGVTPTATVAIAHNQPLFSLGNTVACITALLCGFMISADRDRARHLLAVVAVAGAAYALYGIAAFLIDPSKLLWRDKVLYTNVLTATFPNRNTAAVYFGVVATIWLIFLFEEVRRQLHQVREESLGLSLLLYRRWPSKAVWSLGMTVLCITAMLLTGSRAGVSISFLGMIASFVIFFRRQLPGRTGGMLMISIAALAALLIFEIFGAQVSERFGAHGFIDNGRLEAYRSTMRMILDHPLLGTGLGTYPWSFPAYRSPDISIWGVWDRAHNTLLELAAEMGVPLAAAIAMAWLFALAVLIKGVRQRRRDVIFPLVGLIAASVGLLHSLVDFSLQIPGFAMTVFALTGAGLAQVAREEK